MRQAPIDLRKWLKKAIGSVFAMLVIAATVSPVVSSFVDRGFDGRPRLTAFYLALTLSDESARHAIRNSVIVAAVVTFLATMMGVILGRITAGGRFFGRDALALLTRAPGCYTPMISAVGFLAFLRFIPSDWRDAARWVMLTWVQLAWAVPRIMMAVGAALATVDSSWIDAARLAGVKRGKAFWLIGWPLARSAVSVAASEIFLLTLFDPGAPLVLGLRNTLPVALVESAFDVDRQARAAVLATLGLSLGLVVRGVLMNSGRARWTSTARPPVSVERRAPVPAVLGGYLILGCWVAPALVPLMGLPAALLGLSRSWAWDFSAVLRLVRDGDVFRSLRDSLILGLAVGVVATVIGWAIGPPRARVSWRHPSSWPRVVPPLVVGLGLLLLPGLLDSVATRLGGPLGRFLSQFGDLSDVYMSPWIVLIAGSATLQVSVLSTAFGEAGALNHRDSEEVARTLGASRFRSWLTASAPSVLAILAVAISTAIAASALASAPSILLSRTMRARPIVPVLVEILKDPDGLGRAAGLSLLALAFPFVAWIVKMIAMRRSRGSPLARR